jgi:TetR/AcrR family transcriptional repressor of nem operon
MARLREYDIGDVLQKAMTAFWRRGYSATSMSDIYEATGLKPGNLYAAFKDKEELFRRCFETYADHFRATLPTAATGLPAIDAWLKIQAKLAIEDPERKGCLIINTVTEREAHSAATRALASGRLQEIRDFFLLNLTLAQAQGQIRADLDVNRHADALLGAVISIMSLGRAGADGRMIENIAKAAYEGLH